MPVALPAPIRDPVQRVGQTVARTADDCHVGVEAIQERILDRPRVRHRGVAASDECRRKEKHTPSRPYPASVVIAHGVVFLRGNPMFMIARHRPLP